MKITPAALGAMAQGDMENAMVAATPGGIEAQEEAGQRELVKAVRLPRDMGRNNRKQYETLGFVFGEDHDDLFVNVQLPAGWKYQATDQSMHNEILDNHGRRRVGVFYKAAFYDRSASCNLRIRYTAGRDYSRDGAIYAAFDQGEVFKDLGLAPIKDWEAQAEMEKKAREWLNSEFPDNQNPLAYWDNI